MLPVDYSWVARNGQKYRYALNAMVDSGSPISLIKSSFVPTEARAPVSEDERDFCGINGSRLQILGNFYHEVEIQGILLKLQFFVVPDQTMAFLVILGRDFSSHQSVSITVGESLVVTKRTGNLSDDALNRELKQMSIECISEPSKATENLQINPNLQADEIKRIKNLYESDFQKIKERSTHQTDFEMRVVLKHDQPITFRPRRLSFSDKEKLQFLLDDRSTREKNYLSK